MRTTLITGATGFAGSHLVDRLAGREPVLGWHRPGTVPPGEPRQVRWTGIDVRDRASVMTAIAEARPARIYHVAGASRVDTAWINVTPHLEINVLGTHHLLNAVAQAELDCRVLVVSSALVYAEGPVAVDESAPLRPSSPYGLSKLAQDELARRAAAEQGLDVVIARPFNHIGPRQEPGFAVSSFARQIALIEAGRAAPVIEVGNLDAKRDFCDVRDVVGAYEALMIHGRAGEAYNICSGQASRIGDLLDALIALSRVPVRVVTNPTLLRPSDIPLFTGDATRLRHEAGWTPARPLHDTLADTLNWWREQVASHRP